MSGIFGTFLSISANEIFLFVVFGSLMGLMGLNVFLYELGKLVGRRLAGGAGHTAVVASSLMGMVTGAAVANVAITGAFTIPYMKQAGYRNSLAGAIEATASTGSQVMPPVMGAAAFLMAFFIGVPYAQVMVAAVVPAILFYMTVVLGVQFVAVAEGIAAKPEPADTRAILRGLPLFAVPVAVIAVLLLLHLSPALAAFWAIVTVLVLSFFRAGPRPTLREVVGRAIEGAVVGAQIGIALAAVGMIAQTLIATGLGAKIAGLVVTLSGGSMLAGLVLTMVVALILGCGVPAVAAYSLVAIVAAPSLVRMGVPLMAAHFFCFYFAVISAVTPPVGLAALAAAGIAKASYLETGLAAFKLAIAGFVIPFLVIFNPVLNLHPHGFATALGSLVSIPLGLFALTSALYGVAIDRLGTAQRGAMALAAVALNAYALSWNDLDGAAAFALLAVGVVLLAAVLVAQARNRIAVRRLRLAAEADGASRG
jgi:TRAP transporter 4TM/12TM fusion protein